MTINLSNVKLDAHWVLYDSTSAGMLKALGYVEHSLRRKGPCLLVLMVKDWQAIEGIGP